MTAVDPAVLAYVEAKVGHVLTDAERAYLARFIEASQARSAPPDERHDDSLRRVLGRRLAPSGERRS